MQFYGLRFGQLKFPKRCGEDFFLHNEVERSSLDKVLSLEWWRQIKAQVSSDRVWPYIFELPGIGAHIFLRYQPHLNETLAVLVRLSPSVGIRVVATRAVGRKKLFA